MIKIAYVILVHNLPEQVARLVDRLESPFSHFFIHVDARSESAYQVCREQFKDKESVTLVEKRHRCRWGQYSLVAATLSSLKQVVSYEMEFDYVCLLSGQDYPIKSAGYIHEYLKRNNGTEFLEFFRLDKPNRWTEEGAPFQAMKRIKDYHAAVRSYWIHIPANRTLPKSVKKPYGGSQWWLLTSDCVRWCLDFLSENPDFIRFFRYTIVPDEIFFQNLVMNSPFAEKAVNKNLHFVDFSRGHPTPPVILTQEDLPLLQGLDDLFARKFNSEKDESIMDSLDQWIDSGVGHVQVSQMDNAEV